MATPLILKSKKAVAPGGVHRWKVLGVGVAANASFSAAATGISTTAVWMHSGFHLSNGELGLALGLGELPWGVLTDRWGDRPVLLTGLLSTATVLVAMSLFAVPSIATLGWLVFAMCALGLCSAAALTDRAGAR